MGAGFTPGPWECRRALSPDNTGGYDYGIGADGKVIAEAFEHVDYADGCAGYETRPAAANAHLIAAAPDLYHALDRLLEESADSWVTEAQLMEAGLPATKVKAITIGLAALAKARGEQ